MINELYGLSEALDNAGIQPQNWYRKYKPIPNIGEKAPCVRITISQGTVIGLSAVKKELGAGLRKFGNNQGSYPCMNLTALYRITDEAIKKKLFAFKLRPEDLDDGKISEIKSWCCENNWGGKFQNKYKLCMKNMPNELSALVPEFEPLQILIEESGYFTDPMVFHHELEAAVFRMLNRRENISLALSVLFYRGNPRKEAVDDYGTLSVALETPRLIDMEVPAISQKFVKGLNEALLSRSSSEKNASSTDAFGIPFEPVNEPMPEVKLAGGFNVTLRTMFKEHRCQTRYGRIEDASYPISPEMRKKLQAALNWISSAEQKDTTWTNIDKGEILFAYPARLPEIPISYTRMFRRAEKKDGAFSDRAKQFILELHQSKKAGTDSNAEQIQLFILKKCDERSSRAKVVYTRQTDSHELEVCSEAWTLGCSNLPSFPFGQPNIPFPLDTADILNRFWKQNGELTTDNFKPVPKYFGMELLMETDLSATSELHNLSEKAMTVGAFLGKKLAGKELQHPIWNKMKDMLALIGLLLYRKGIRKDIYMENLPYLYGQLLKVSDELHVLYCNVVRKGDLPTQLAGSSLYQAAAEAPVRTLHLLGQRVNPYITWAKTYRTKKEEESWRAGWLLSMYEKIATKLYAAWHPQARFNDEEKAQLFIGYLAAFPKKEQGDNNEESSNQNEEVNNHE